MYKRIRFILILLAVLLSGLYFKSLIPGNVSSQDTSSMNRSTESVNMNTAPVNQATQPISTSTALLKQQPTGEKNLNSQYKITLKDLETLKKDLQNYLKNFTGKYGVYYYNLVNGEEFGINQEEEYTAASTIKVPLNLYLYQKIKSASVNPENKLTYMKVDYEDGTGNIQYEDLGNKYSIRELSKFSIVSSDNVAANMLFRFLGMANIKKYMRSVGGVVVDDNENISSPEDMGLYMKLVYKFYKDGGALGNELMNNLLNTEFNDRLPALLPKYVKVAHKIGTQVNVINDVGIVFSDEPYILSVMSDNVDEDEAPGIIANISKKVYDFVNRKSIVYTK